MRSDRGNVRLYPVILWYLIITFYLMPTLCVFAQGLTEKRLAVLQDEQSRADLFQLVIAAAQQAEEGQPIPFNLYGPFVFPTDATVDAVAHKPRTNSIFGIDISHYTRSDLPFSSLAPNQIKYVYAKATQGTTFEDGKFRGFWSAMGRLTGRTRVHRGAYHFLSSNKSETGIDQAKTFLRVLHENQGLTPTDMPPVLDLEWDMAHKGAPDRWAGQDPDKILDKALAWLSYVESQTHRSPLLYTAAAWWRGIGGGQQFTRLNKYHIWIADYSRSSRGVEVPKMPPGMEATLWQFTEAAELKANHGASAVTLKNLDANIYKQEENKFYSEFHVERFH